MNVYSTKLRYNKLTKKKKIKEPRIIESNSTVKLMTTANEQILDTQKQKEKGKKYNSHSYLCKILQNNAAKRWYIKDA